jgi:hypothetical protein
MLTQVKIGPVTLLVLVVLLTLLVVIHKDHTAKKPKTDFAAVTFIAVMALFAFVTWTFLRTNKWAKESGASGTTASVG